MKKALAFVLTVVLLISMSVSVYAMENPVAVKECAEGKCEIVLEDSCDQLPEGKKEAFAEAKERLMEPVTEEYECVFFAFHNVQEGCTSCDTAFIINEAAADEAVTAQACEAYTISAPVKTDAEVIARQFIDGEWVRKEAAFDTATIFVEDVEDAPIALYQWTRGNAPSEAQPVYSPNVDPPKVITMGCDDCKIVTWSSRDILADAKKATFVEAKGVLKDAVPEGFSCRDFVYQDVNDDCTACNIGMLMSGVEVVDENTEAEWLHDNEALDVCSAYRVSLSLDGVTEVVIKQYVNKEWVEKEIAVDTDSIVIQAVVDGPIAIFMK